MNGGKNGKARDLPKPVPGCMGRMVGIFDLSGTKMLTDKSHQDGSPLHRNRAEVIGIGAQSQKEGDSIFPISLQILNGLRNSSKKIDGIPMSLLIAEEMSKDEESKRIPPNVVAKLMGLDALPNQHSDLDARISLAGRVLNNDKLVPCEIQSCAEGKKCKDVYEIHRGDCNPFQRGRHGDNSTEKKMALVRQKFLEAKFLATDEKLIRSKEFQEALEVLSSNRDLFVKVLDDPNSLFSKHLQDFQTLRPLSQPRRITVLKPAKMAESKDDEQLRIHRHPPPGQNISEMNKHHWSSGLIRQKAGSVSRSTRIVVLKPDLEKLNEFKNTAVRPNTLQSLIESKDFYEDVGSCAAMGSGEEAADEAGESRVEAKEITQQTEDSLSSNRIDEAFLSPVLSNGYDGDDSSLNRPEIEEYGCNFSDLETTTPTSRYSWCSRLDHPPSVSFSSHASCSAESSVIREAKKRLSERCAMVTLNVSSHEQKQDPSSSTLGEMLAIPLVKKEEKIDRTAASSSRSCVGDQGSSSMACAGDPGSSSICGTFDEFNGEKSPRNLSRTKSAPISSLFCGGTGLKDDVPLSLLSILPKSIEKLKSGKLSLKDKVSSLFLSKIKKMGSGKLLLGPLVSSEVRHPEECGRAPCKVDNGPRTPFEKAALSLEASRKSRENQDQPSPVSVLEAAFRDDINNDYLQLSGSSIVGNPQALSRAPLIESLARSLSFDNARFQSSLPKTTYQSTLLSKENRFVFVQKLLSSAKLNSKKSKMVLAAWHSLDSPLDPMLLEDFLSRKEEEATHRAKRSNQRLLFDCVNVALSEIGHRVLVLAYPWVRTLDASLKGIPDAQVTDIVWRLICEWSSGEGEWVFREGKSMSSVVDGMVKMELARTEWVEKMSLERDDFGNEISNKLLDELVEEVLADMTGNDASGPFGAWTVLSDIR